MLFPAPPLRAPIPLSPSPLRVRASLVIVVSGPLGKLRDTWRVAPDETTVLPWPPWVIVVTTALAPLAVVAVIGFWSAPPRAPGT